MAAHVLRLRIDLLLGALRGDARAVVRRVLGALLLLGGTVVACAGLLRLQTGRTDVVAEAIILVASAVILGLFVVPLAGGGDDQLDPRRFAVFGVAPRPLAVGILLASLVSVPFAALVAVAVSVALLWVAHGAPVAAASAGAGLVVVTCLLVSRVALLLAALLLPDRRSRELTGLLAVAVAVVVLPVGILLSSVLLASGRGTEPSSLSAVADVLARTPLGAAAAFPARAASGAGGPELAIAIATVLVLGGAWFWLVHIVLTRVSRPTPIRERRGLGWFSLVPGTPAGTIAARSLTYWLRDPRYLVNLLIVPVGAAVTLVPLLVVGVPISTAILLPAPLMALLFGWLAHNDLAYDSTAVWMHIAAGVRGSADRAGRLVPVVLVAVPVLAVSIAVTVSLHGRWALLPALVGVCASLFLCGLGLSSISSAAAPYPASRPGDGPFQQPQRTRGGLAQGVVLLGAIVLSAPVLWWGWRALAQDVDDGWVALWSGLGIGTAVLVIGILVGGFVFRRRGSRLMEFAESS